MRFKNQEHEYSRFILPITNEEDEVLIVLNNGYGKITKISEITVHNRGGKGIRLIKGKDVAFAEIVTNKETVSLITKQGLIIKTPKQNIAVLSRNARGVKIINLKEKDCVAGGFVA